MDSTSAIAGDFARVGERTSEPDHGQHDPVDQKCPTCSPPVRLWIASAIETHPPIRNEGIAARNAHRKPARP
jgi:hypothetical protein